MNNFAEEVNLREEFVRPSEEDRTADEISCGNCDLTVGSGSHMCQKDLCFANMVLKNRIKHLEQ